MSLQALQHLQGQWRQQLGGLQMTWARLHHNPQLHHVSHMRRLAGMLQASYGISRSDADAQVTGFYARKNQRDSGRV